MDCLGFRLCVLVYVVQASDHICAVVIAKVARELEVGRVLTSVVPTQVDPDGTRPRQRGNIGEANGIGALLPVVGRGTAVLVPLRKRAKGRQTTQLV